MKALNLLAEAIAKGSDAHCATASVDPGFAVHLAACLSEGMCPFGHSLTIPEPAMFWIAEPGTGLDDDGWQPLGTTVESSECRQCDPPARWSVTENGWYWERVAPRETLAEAEGRKP